MTKEEFDSLNVGDIIKNEINGANYVIIHPKVPIDPIIQIKKAALSHMNNYERYKIIVRAIK